MSTPKQPVITAVLITYINYSITENYIGKMGSGASPQSSASHLLTFLVAQLQFANGNFQIFDCTRFSNVDF